MSTIPLEPLPESNPHTQQVRDGRATVRTMLERIPGFAHPAKGARRRLNFSANLSDHFLEAVAMAIEASGPLQAAARITAADLRNAIAFERAYRSLAEDLEVQAKALRYTIAVTRSDVAELALQAYNLAKGLNRPSDQQLLVPHLANIKKALIVRRKAKPEEAPAPAPPAGGTL